MTANLLVLKARKRQNPLAPADPSDFEFENGQTIDPMVVVTNPLITLYCLDHANQRALFIETAPGANLSAAPFFYQAQYENAVNLFSVSYESLHKLASAISLDSRHLILVYSVGRAGSTLLGSALSAVEGVVGISEPDVFTQLVMLRDFSGSNDAEISRLVETCMKLQCKPTEQIPNPKAWAVKFRSFGIELGDLLYKNFSAAKNIFIYRNAETWMTSTMRAFVENEHSIESRTFFQGFLSTMVPSIAKHVQSGGEVLTFSSIGSMMWLRAMEKYMELHEDGMPGLAVRYEDLKAAPQETMKKIVEYCGFPNADMEAVYRVLEKDAQAGSAFSQENLGQKNFKMTDAHRADLARILQEHPVINSPDFMIPTSESVS